MQYTLSYVLTTFNKLDYLKITLPLLIEARKPDEEIVVVDGGSTDGTKVYLENLLKENKIQVVLSEKDKGEAHGINKALFLAKGDWIKIVTDDDLYDFEAIQVCKTYMQNHPDTDVLGFDGYSSKVMEKTRFEKTNFIEGFHQRKKDGSAFLFCGLSLLIRRSSLSYLGLFNANYKIIDMEYSLRITSMKSKVAFYTGHAFINIVNPASNSVKFYDVIRKEYHRLRRTYPEARLNFRINNPILMMKERLNRLTRKLKPAPLPAPETLLLQYETLIQKGLELFKKNRNTAYEILDSEI
ncbi:MAG: glycosyltransferase family 2 protein [Bacteroidia bacterium]|nr:glycosyltransferase family 2 protein [Bacteroidia bacterium]